MVQIVIVSSFLSLKLLVLNIQSHSIWCESWLSLVLCLGSEMSLKSFYVEDLWSSIQSYGFWEVIGSRWL
jgi:hypothetical protein